MPYVEKLSRDMIQDEKLTQLSGSALARHSLVVRDDREAYARHVAVGGEQGRPAEGIGCRSSLL
jgi:hypothetical protein